MHNYWHDGQISLALKQEVDVKLAVPMPGTAKWARHGLTLAQPVFAACEGANTSAGPRMGQEVLVHNDLQIQRTYFGTNLNPIPIRGANLLKILLQ